MVVVVVVVVAVVVDQCGFILVLMDFVIQDKIDLTKTYSF